MFDIVFPLYTTQRYYNTHYKYVYEIFKYLGCNITFDDRDGFVVDINKKKFLFDYADDCNLIPGGDIKVFKFHCNEPTDRIIPFPPISFYNWDEYYYLEKKIQYNPNSNLIGSRQRRYGNARVRRSVVQELLLSRFQSGKELLLDEVAQNAYWAEVQDILISVCVPGFDNNICDRGFVQYNAFGCPSIRPTVYEKLPLGRNYVPEVHYIECESDYGNLVESVCFLRDVCNRDYLRFIGEQAKQLFQQTSTPEAIGQWISQHL